MRSKIFLEVGGYDDSLFSHPSIEDVELNVLEAGDSICLVPDAQGTHWKDWTLWRVWHTDVVRRALPWSRLIADVRAPAADLNLARKEQFLAVLALSTLVALVGGFFFKPLWLAAVAAIALLCDRNFPVRACPVAAHERVPVDCRTGLIFITSTASVTYVSVMLATRLGLRRRGSFRPLIKQAPSAVS